MERRSRPVPAVFLRKAVLVSGGSGAGYISVDISTQTKEGPRYKSHLLHHSRTWSVDIVEAALARLNNDGNKAIASWLRIHAASPPELEDVDLCDLIFQDSFWSYFHQTLDMPDHAGRELVPRLCVRALQRSEPDTPENAQDEAARLILRHGNRSLRPDFSVSNQERIVESAIPNIAPDEWVTGTLSSVAQPAAVVEDDARVTPVMLRLTLAVSALLLDNRSVDAEDLIRKALPHRPAQHLHHTDEVKVVTRPYENGLQYKDRWSVVVHPAPFSTVADTIILSSNLSLAEAELLKEELSGRLSYDNRNGRTAAKVVEEFDVECIAAAVAADLAAGNLSRWSKSVLMSAAEANGVLLCDGLRRVSGPLAHNREFAQSHCASKLFTPLPEHQGASLYGYTLCDSCVALTLTNPKEDSQARLISDRDAFKVTRAPNPNSACIEPITNQMLRDLAPPLWPTNLGTEPEHKRTRKDAEAAPVDEGAYRLIFELVSGQGDPDVWRAAAVEDADGVAWLSFLVSHSNIAFEQKPS